MDISSQRKIAVDSEAADVVWKIFEGYVSGESCIWIANSLNELGLPSPGLYRFLNGGIIQQEPECKMESWKKYKERIEANADVPQEQGYRWGSELSFLL